MMSLGNREGKDCEETEPEELPETVKPKYAASDRRMVKYKCAFLSLCRRAFFLAGILDALDKHAFSRSRTRNSDSSVAMVEK